MAVSFGAGLITVSTTWQSLKSLVILKGLALQYDEDDVLFTLFAIDNPIGYLAFVYKGTPPDSIDPIQNAADRTEFVNNYQPISNRPVAQPSPPPADPNLVVDNRNAIVFDDSPIYSERNYG